MRFYSVDEMAQLEYFKSELCRKQVPRANSLIGSGKGPWGICTERGAKENGWDDIDATVYKVRGPSYLKDKRKISSGAAISELLVVDLFTCDTDIDNVAACVAAKTVQRLRRDGEDRRLLVLNFRLVPLHVVIVWALPASTPDAGPSRDLLARFASDDMDTAERNSRLKVIPRVLTGPWPIRKLLGENSAAILGRGIPVTYHSSENELEVSVSIASSSAAQRVSKALLRAGSALEIELGLVVEGKSESELPEQILGGFRVSHADLNNIRHVDPNSCQDTPMGDTETEGAGETVKRPAGLPPLES